MDIELFDFGEFSGVLLNEESGAVPDAFAVEEVGEFLVGEAVAVAGVDFISDETEDVDGIIGKIAASEEGHGSFRPASGDGVVEIGFNEMAEEVAYGNPFKAVGVGFEMADAVK